jgi:hypothetical protein
VDCGTIVRLSASGASQRNPADAGLNRRGTHATFKTQRELPATDAVCRRKQQQCLEFADVWTAFERFTPIFQTTSRETVLLLVVFLGKR